MESRVFNNDATVCVEHAGAKRQILNKRNKAAAFRRQFLQETLAFSLADDPGSGLMDGAQHAPDPATLVADWTIGEREPSLLRGAFVRTSVKGKSSK